jgi:hypothetical protein
MTQETQKSSTENWFTKSPQLSRPEKMREIKQRIRENAVFLFNALLEHPDATKVGNALRELNDDTKACWLFIGYQSGFSAAKHLAKISGQKDERHEAEIRRIIIQHRDWKTKQILEESDEKEIPFIRLGRLPKTRIQRWSDVASEPSYKVLVSRIRFDMRHLSHMNRWARAMREYQKLLKEHEKLHRE